MVNVDERLVHVKKWLQKWLSGRVVIVALLLVVFLFSGYKVAWKYVEYERNARLYASLSAQYGPESAVIAAATPPAKQLSPDEPHSHEASAPAPTVPERSLAPTPALEPIDLESGAAQGEGEPEPEPVSAEEDRMQKLKRNIFEDSNELMKINADTVGWIKIPDTNIDYPIVQAKDNDYYLTRDFTKKRNSGGSIFLDYRNDGNMGNANNIIYGHNMRDKSMFQNVMNYKDKEFFENNRIIYTYTPEGVQQWEVFLLFVTDTSFDYLHVDFDSDREFNDYIRAVWRKAWQKADVQLTAADKLLTLSTCSYEYDDARTVLMARLIEEA